MADNEMNADEKKVVIKFMGKIVQVEEGEADEEGNEANVEEDVKDAVGVDEKKVDDMVEGMDECEEEPRKLDLLANLAHARIGKMKTGDSVHNELYDASDEVKKVMEVKTRKESQAVLDFLDSTRNDNQCNRIAYDDHNVEELSLSQSNESVLVYRRNQLQKLSAKLSLDRMITDSHISSLNHAIAVENQLHVLQKQINERNIDVKKLQNECQVKDYLIKSYEKKVRKLSKKDLMWKEIHRNNELQVSSLLQDKQLLQKELIMISKQGREKDDILKEQSNIIENYRKEKVILDREIQAQIKALEQDKQALQGQQDRLVGLLSISKDIGSNVSTNNLEKNNQSSLTHKSKTMTPTSSAQNKSPNKMSDMTDLQTLTSCVTPSIARASMIADNEFDCSLQSKKSSSETKCKCSVILSDEDRSVDDEELGEGKHLTSSSVTAVTKVINKMPTQIEYFQRDVFTPVWNILREQGHDETSNWKYMRMKYRFRELGPSYVFAVPSCHDVSDGIENETFFKNELDLILFVIQELQKEGAPLKNDKVEWIHLMKVDEWNPRRSRSCKKKQKPESEVGENYYSSLLIKNSTQSIESSKFQSNKKRKFSY